MLGALVAFGTWCAAAGGRAATAATRAATPATRAAAPATRAAASAGRCPHFGKPALAGDARPHALRVFAIQFAQQPAQITDAAAYTHAIDCALRAEVVPYLVAGEANLVVFDEDVGLEALAAGPRGGTARALLRHGVGACRQHPSAECETLATLSALDLGYRGARAVFAPTEGRAYDQTFLWGPRVSRRGAPAPLANLIAVNRKVPLTGFEQALGFAPGASGGAAAKANLRPVPIPGTGARLGFATSLPAFAYGGASPGHECDNVTKTYMRCLDSLGANVVIQADANDGQWTGPDGSDPAEHWQPLSWMGSAWRAVSDPTVRFAYAVNPFMVGNLSDTPFDGQSAIFERGRRGLGCHYVGNGAFVPGEDDPALRSFAGAKPQFLALAPWALPDRPRAALRPAGAALAAATGRYHYVQTAVIADLPFPADRARRGCVVAGR